MKNIQKIAEEVFKTPSVEELLNRALEDATVISREEFQKWLADLKDQNLSTDLSNLLNWFPRGAHYLMHLESAFKALDKLLTQHQLKLKFITKLTDDTKLYHTVWKNRNILMIVFFDHSVCYLVEKL